MPNLAKKLSPVVDADGHVLESRVDWVERLGPDLADVAPRFLNGMHLFVEGQVLPRSRDLLGPTNNPRPRLSKSEKYWSFNRKGQHEPEARIADMNEEGIDIAFLFGSYISQTAMGGIQNPVLATALARSFNDWIHDEYCSHDPQRLKAVGVLPMQDPSAAAQEIRRCVDKGITAVQTFPHISRKPLHDPSFDVVWATAQEVGMPICVHIVNSYGSMADLFQTFGQKHVFIPVDMMAAVASFSACGIFEKFPTLKVGLFEAGVGWLPWLGSRLDSHVEILAPDFGNPERKPSEWITSENLFFGVESEDEFIAQAAAEYGVERLLYSSDYAHFDCECPETVTELFENETLSSTDKTAIAGGNAMKFFGLESVPDFSKSSAAIGS
ncbi:MAG: amidohydrolase [Actinomycetia bacterium]|nr:amidohydrolase [Actinomycetes bacterium]